jgi:hypothetical protein
MRVPVTNPEELRLRAQLPKGAWPTPATWKMAKLLYELERAHVVGDRGAEGDDQR